MRHDSSQASNQLTAEVSNDRMLKHCVATTVQYVITGRRGTTLYVAADFELPLDTSGRRGGPSIQLTVADSQPQDSVFSGKQSVLGQVRRMPL